MLYNKHLSPKHKKKQEEIKAIIERKIDQRIDLMRKKSKKRLNSSKLKNYGSGNCGAGSKTGIREDKSDDFTFR
jgi:hypothetical protein